MEVISNVRTWWIGGYGCCCVGVLSEISAQCAAQVGIGVKQSVIKEGIVQVDGWLELGY